MLETESTRGSVAGSHHCRARALAAVVLLSLVACGPSHAVAARPAGPLPLVPGPAAATPTAVIVPVAPPPEPVPPPPFTGLDADDLLALSPDECHALLDSWGVPWERAEDAPETIADPVRLAGPAGGVLFLVPGDDVAPHDVLDCRFAAALAEWGALLAARGVAEVDAYGLYRRGPRIGSHVRAEPTQHNYGLAIDAARFELADGTKLDVLGDWGVSGGEDWTCDATPDDEAGALLLAFFCDPADASIFHVSIGPEHDAEHRNHLHFDLGGAGGEGGWFLD